MKNRKNIVLPVLFISGIFIMSCSTKKNITYLMDLEDEATMKGVPADPEEHTIRPNDNLYVSVRTINPEINELFANTGGSEGASAPRYESGAGQYISGYQVDNDGLIILPVIGAVKLKGLTLKQAQTEIQKKADEYLKEANIQVKLLNFKINILGEVSKPGVYYNYNNSLTILESIGMAGGITEYAGLKDVVVVRMTPDGTKSYKIDLTKKNALKSEAFSLQPNDLVYIKPQSMKSTRLNSGMYSLFLSSISTIILILKFWN